MGSSPSLDRAVSEPHPDQEWHRPWVGLALTLAVGAVLTVGFVRLPREGAALSTVARHALAVALPDWGQTEVVSEIVYGTRGFDTFGETFLLLAAVVAVTTLTRSRETRAQYVGEASAGQQEQREVDPDIDSDAEESTARRAEREEGDEQASGPDADSAALGSAGPGHEVAMTVVVRVGARIAAVVLAVASIYLAAWGYTPGGGFPAGAAVAGVAILLYGALGHRAVRGALRPGLLEPIELAGAVGIIVIGLLGLVFRGSMFANFLTVAQPQTIRAGGTNQLYSGSELVEVATGLLIAIFSLLGMRHDWTRAEDEQ